MKQLLITGISQETPLENPQENHIYLVFNHGECRVPTNEAGVDAVMRALAAGEEEEAAVAPAHPDAGAGVEVFDGDASQDPRFQSNEWLAQQEERANEETEENEEYDVNDGVGSI
jgi:hypothetical protein